jgi:hypothetical protein
MEISSLQNVNIIPLLNEGNFLSKKGEEIIEEEQKPKSKQTTNKGKSKKKAYNEDEDSDVKINEKIDYES